MKKYLGKAMMVCMLIFGMLAAVCLNDTLYAATKKVVEIDAKYEGEDALEVGDKVDPKMFRVIVTYDDGTEELLGTQEFDVILSSDSLEIEDTDDYAIISYGSKWTRVHLEIVGSGQTPEDEVDRKLLSISATYEGDPVSVDRKSVV